MNKILFLTICSVTLACTEQKDYTLKIRGSESMYETFAALKKDYESLQDSVTVNLEGGGSLTGLIGVKGKEVNIGLSSFGFDLDSLFGVRRSVQERIVAYDGIVLINNKQNPIQQLSNIQITNLYNGKISDWSQLGADLGPVLPIIRDENSGTQKLFALHFGLGEISDAAKVAESNVEIVSEVIENRNAIGFIGFAYYSFGVNDLPIESNYNGDSIFYSLPSANTIANDVYPLKRPLRIYYHNDDDNPALASFLKYLQSEQAMSVVESFGLISSTVQPTLAQKN